MSFSLPGPEEDEEPFHPTAYGIYTENDIVGVGCGIGCARAVAQDLMHDNPELRCDADRASPQAVRNHFNQCMNCGNRIP